MEEKQILKKDFVGNQHHCLNSESYYKQLRTTFLAKTNWIDNSTNLPEIPIDLLDSYMNHDEMVFQFDCIGDHAAVFYKENPISDIEDLPITKSFDLDLSLGHDVFVFSGSGYYNDPSKWKDYAISVNYAGPAKVLRVDDSYIYTLILAKAGDIVKHSSWFDPFYLTADPEKYYVLGCHGCVNYPSGEDMALRNLGENNFLGSLCPRTPEGFMTQYCTLPCVIITGDGDEFTCDDDEEVTEMWNSGFEREDYEDEY